MTFEILVSREAQADIAVAVSGYRDIAPILGTRFGEELERIYSSIAEYPQMYPVVYKNFRRGLLHKYPYSVFYVLEESFVLIVGVIHQSRDESTWKRRAQ